MDRKETFDREFVKADHRSIWIDRRKWKSFEEFLENVKGKADTVIIRAPEVLGDTYREFVLNLAALGDAGLRLEIMPSHTRGEGLGKVFWGANGEREIIVEKSPHPMLSNANGSAPPPKPAGWRTGISLLRRGRTLPVVIHSYGPDMVYCQAELLLRFAKEEFKPSNQGRAICGVYAFSSSTLDEFLYEVGQNDADLERLERFRLEILKRGWESFVVADEDAEEYVEKVRQDTEKKEKEKEKV